MKTLLLFGCLVCFLGLILVQPVVADNSSKETSWGMIKALYGEDAQGTQWNQKGGGPSSAPWSWPQSMWDFKLPFADYDPVRGMCLAGCRINCGYGCYLHKNEYYPGAAKHSIDLVRAVGSSSHHMVLAPARGIVVFAERMNGYGWCVVMDHGNGFKSIVAHLEEDPNRYVSPGDDLLQGTFLGWSGSSGGDWAPHYHLSIWYNNRTTPLNGISGYGDLRVGPIYYSGNSPVRPPKNSPW